MKVRSKCEDCGTDLPEWDRFTWKDKQDLRAAGIRPICRECLSREKVGWGLKKGGG